MSHVVGSIAASCLAALAACGYPALPVAGPREIKEFPIQASRDVDLLFLIDDSPSMSDKQINLASNFPRLIEVLSSIPGGLPNLHLGVATTDLGTKGADDAAPGPPIGLMGMGGCSNLGKNGALQLFGAPVTGEPFLVDVADGAGGRTRNYTGSLADVFAQIARGAGAGGCGFEQPLQAIHQALDPANTANAGFVRPDASLGILIVTDEDDCSLAHSSLLTTDTAMLGELQSFRCARFGLFCDQGGRTPDEMNTPGAKAGCRPDDGSPYLSKVSDHVALVTGLKPDPAKVFVGVLAGPTEPVMTVLGMQPGFRALAHSCTYLGGDVNGDGNPDPQVADPPVRLKAFVDPFGARAAFSTICQQDLSDGLRRFGDLVKAAIGDPCLERKLADVDPKAAGVQDGCEVTVSSRRDQPQPTETALPRCVPDDATAANVPCWRLEIDDATCALGDHVRVRVEGQDRLPGDARLEVSCVIEE